MTGDPKPGDRVAKFAFADLPVRGELVHLDRAWRDIRRKDVYPPEVAAVLGEALAASVLLSSCLKFEGLLTLQITGDGPMHLLVVQCSHQREVRGLARWAGDVAGSGFRTLAGSGKMAVTVEAGGNRGRYQAIVPIAGATLAESLELYFRQSVQVPTRIWLSSDPRRVKGMLLQRLPGADEAGEDWRRLQSLAGTVPLPRLAGLSDEALLQRLFGGDDLRIYPAGPVHFHCSCSEARVAAMLRTLGREEFEALIAEAGEVDVRCEFCNHRYQFLDEDAGALFGPQRAGESPVTLH